MAWEEDVKAELDRLEAIGVISRVSEATSWISALVVEQKKSGKLHLCLDPRLLNKALKQSVYPIPVVDYLLRLSKAKVFSVLDAQNVSGSWTLIRNPAWQHLLEGIDGSRCLLGCLRPRNIPGKIGPSH